MNIQIHQQNIINDKTQCLWNSLFNLENPIECLIELKNISKTELLLISPTQASFLTSLYTNQFSDYPDELLIQTSLLLSSLFSNNISLVSLFDKFGLFSLVYPLFPNFKIPSFLHFYAEESFQCSKYLIENGFIQKLISLLSSFTNDLDTDTIEDNDNLLDYILCVGSICDINQYEDQLLPFCPILNSIILDQTDWKVQCEAINSLSTLLKNSETAAKDFLLEDSIIDIISTSKCESNIQYLKSVINLIGSLFKYPQFLNESLFDTMLSIISSSLNLFKDECGSNASFESCISLIANVVADNCSDDNPNFSQQCMGCGIVQTFFEIFNDENSWKLKINVFEAILNLFSYGLPDIDILDAFLELDVIELILDNLIEMCYCNGYAITSTFNSIISLLNETDSDKNSILKDFLLSSDVEQAIDMLLQSEDPEIKYSTEKVYSFIQSLDEDE